jgi:hypothetical protein
VSAKSGQNEMIGDRRMYLCSADDSDWCNGITELTISRVHSICGVCN